MNLPDLVGKISNTFTDSEALWKAVGLPDVDQEQRRQSFYETIANTCSEFFQTQQSYK